MPMMNSFVPEKLRPWLFVLIAICFQLSGARYMGPLNEIIGAHGNMREDMLMCMYANLAGMALWFPLLFRMKFRFTNKTLLTASAITVIVTNLLTMQVTFLPLLWILCFIEGIAKLQGTFECMSNIQLWITPKRDFKVFFPVLHLFILGAINAQDLLSSYFGWLGHWQLMHWLTIGLMLLVLTIILTCTHHFRFMKMPLFGVDWTGFVLWAALLLQVAFVLDYGEFYNWWHTDVIWYLTGTIIATLGVIVGRMINIRHPYISPRVFTGFKFVKPIFILVVLYEAVMGTEYVLEEVFLENVLEYDTLTNSSLVWPVWIGMYCGIAFTLLWMRYVKSYTYIRMGIIGSCFVLAYVVLMYLTVTPGLDRASLWLPLFCRGVGYATMSIMFFVSLQDSMDFHHFFQGLSIFNTLHMVVGGCIGSAIYGHLLNYYMARLSPLLQTETVGTVMTMSVKSIYGWVAFVALALLLGFLMFDSPIRREHPRLMLPWEYIGRRLAKHLKVTK